MGKSIKDIVKQANKARQKGGLLLAGSGRAGPMIDKRHPTAKQARQQWKKRVNAGEYHD